MRSNLVVTGSGPDLVLIPGIQGRWEWMSPAVRALARRFRVITFSLTSAMPPADGDAKSATAARTCAEFDAQLAQVDEALDRAGAERAVVCGVSYGGLVAVRYAAVRPARVCALVLASTPGPRWKPDARVRRYTARPWLSAPAFVLGARARLWHEVSAARARRLQRVATLGRYLWAVASHPASPARMAHRVRVLGPCDFARDARGVAAPTLVITGEPDLDRVVPVAETLEYLSLIPGAQARTLGGTGHIGLVTKADEFASAIAAFVEAAVERRGN